MKLLDERGIGTVWSICKEKFALAGHTHNYAGSGSPGGSANSAIGVVDYNQTDKTIQIGYSGTGITGDQIKYIAGYTDGSGNVNAKIKDVSKDALRAWLGLGSLAYSSSSIPTNLSLLNNDKGFVTGSVSGNTVTINGSSTTWTNTWRGILDNLTSTSTSESLSANLGRVLKELVDGKANSSHTHNSLAAVGNELISATAYGSGLHFKPYYSSNGPTTYGNILEYTSTNTGGGQLAMEWTGGQTESDGTDSNVGRVYYRSKRDCINGWTKWMTLAYINDIPTKLSLLTNDKGFVTGSVSGNTVTINGSSTTWTNTWRGIQDNLTSTSTSESLSANQGRILKSLVDGKANSSHTHSWSLISVVPIASTKLSGIMSSTDKAKLDGIASGANNYKLPTASANTLGGIKVSGNANGSSWPICVDSNGLALAKIHGLVKGDGVLSSVILSNETHSTSYNYNAINIEDRAAKKRVDIGFPPKSGTLALTSDLSNLCRFNFVNSISECRSDRINFLFRCPDSAINLSPFDSYPDGTILLITFNDSLNRINHQSGMWYTEGSIVDQTYLLWSYNTNINLITKNNGIVHHYSL